MPLITRVAVLPAYDAAHTIADLVRGLLAPHGFDEVWVIDDGSSDDTARMAREASARVVSHATNQGKAAALRTALAMAERRGIDAIVTLDADGQHLVEDAIALDHAVADRAALVLGIRDMARDGAPTANQRGNRIANYWVRLFTQRAFVDSQCGLRRYPVPGTNQLGVRGERFAFETEVLIRALDAGLSVIEVPVGVRYPAERTSHFHVWRDPLRMTLRLIFNSAVQGTLSRTLGRLDLSEALDIHFGKRLDKRKLLVFLASALVTAETG